LHVGQLEPEVRVLRLVLSRLTNVRYLERLERQQIVLLEVRNLDPDGRIASPDVLVARVVVHDRPDRVEPVDGGERGLGLNFLRHFENSFVSLERHPEPRRVCLSIWLVFMRLTRDSALT